MLIVPDVLSAEALAEVRTRLAALELADGRASAGPVSREVKRNLQTRPGDPGALELAAMVREALLASHLFLVHAWPVLWSNMLFSRYGPGDGYGLHVDDAFVGTQEPRMRTDFSFTLFLSEPDAYEGGALTLDDPAGARSVRLPAGERGRLSDQRRPPRRSGDGGRAACRGRMGAEPRPPCRSARHIVRSRAATDRRRRRPPASAAEDDRQPAQDVGGIVRATTSRVTASDRERQAPGGTRMNWRNSRMNCDWSE